MSALGFAAAHMLSLVPVSEDCSWLQCSGSSPQGLPCCGAWVPGPQWLQPVGFVALQHVESSRTGDWTPVPFIGKPYPLDHRGTPAFLVKKLMGEIPKKIGANRIRRGAYFCL